ncbi:MAG: hypothetical protein JW894_06285 [Bacteroidales bacterium]|nr:hypothetical protein [Bacteroidales bacterium]
MKKEFQILRQVLMILILSVCLNNIAHCQESDQDTVYTKIIEFDQGCKLVLDSNINLTDSVSIKIIEGISSILPRIQKLIPADSVTINLAISTTDIIPVWGMSGRTTGDDSGETVELYFDPNHPNFKIEYMLRSFVHEMHHVGRIRNPDFELTLLECMVNEGLAIHFTAEVLNCKPTSLSLALTEEQIQQYMIRIKPYLRVKFESWTAEFEEEYYIPWMFGRDGDEPVPKWTGYSIGWRIVDNYLKEHPEERPSSLVWTPAEIIVSSTPLLVVDNENK